MAFKVFWDVDSKFDMQAWMVKVAESKQCARAVYLNGKVVEVVVRF
jgi:hypothetical protein